MTHIIKNIFFSALLVMIMGLFLKTDFSDFIIGILFFAASFLFALSVARQSFTLARAPVLFINGWFLFFYLTPSEIIGKYFLLITGMVFFMVFCLCDHFSFLFKSLPNITGLNSEKFIKRYAVAKNLILDLLFITAFIWYADAFIIYSNLGYPFYITLLLIFFITFFLSSFILRICSKSEKSELSRELSLCAWTSGLVIAQVSWVVGFWPFGYLTASFIITIIYYTIMSILKEYLFGTIEKKGIMGELMFAILMILLIFNYTKWLP